MKRDSAREITVRLSLVPGRGADGKGGRGKGERWKMKRLKEGRGTPASWLLSMGRCFGSGIPLQSEGKESPHP